MESSFVPVSPEAEQKKHCPCGCFVGEMISECLRVRRVFSAASSRLGSDNDPQTQALTCSLCVCRSLKPKTCFPAKARTPASSSKLPRSEKSSYITEDKNLKL